MKCRFILVIIFLVGCMFGEVYEYTARGGYWHIDGAWNRPGIPSEHDIAVIPEDCTCIIDCDIAIESMHIYGTVIMSTNHYIYAESLFVNGMLSSHSNVFIRPFDHGNMTVNILGTVDILGDLYLGSKTPGCNIKLGGVMDLRNMYLMGNSIQFSDEASISGTIIGIDTYSLITDDFSSCNGSEIKINNQNGTMQHRGNLETTENGVITITSNIIEGSGIINAGKIDISCGILVNNMDIQSNMTDLNIRGMSVSNFRSLYAYDNISISADSLYIEYPSHIEAGNNITFSGNSMIFRGLHETEASIIADNNIKICSTLDGYIDLTRCPYHHVIRAGHEISISSEDIRTPYDGLSDIFRGILDTTETFEEIYDIGIFVEGFEFEDSIYIKILNFSNIETEIAGSSMSIFSGTEYYATGTLAPFDTFEFTIPVIGSLIPITTDILSFTASYGSSMSFYDNVLVNLELPFDIYEEIDKPMEFAMDIYPNPFNSVAVVETPENSTVEIYNLLGTMVDALPGGNAVFKPSSDLTDGVYIVKAESEGKSMVRRIVYIK